MKKVKQIITVSFFMLFTLVVQAQQFSKADQSVIADYSITVEKINQYMLFEKGFGAAKAAEPKYASLTPARTLDEKVNLLSQLPSFIRLVKSTGSNFRDITLTGASLHILFVANDPKRQVNFKKMCDMGYAEKPSAEQMAFAEVHRSEMLQWQQQILEYGKAELSK
jgi:hypothetical protein